MTKIEITNNSNDILALHGEQLITGKWNSDLNIRLLPMGSEPIAFISFEDCQLALLRLHSNNPITEVVKSLGKVNELYSVSRFEIGVMKGILDVACEKCELLDGHIAFPYGMKLSEAYLTIDPNKMVMITFFSE
jgi:hypothetical protein